MKKMRVLFDHQIFSYQNVGGISKYFTELYKKYKTFDNIEVLLGLKNNVNYYLKQEIITLRINIKNINSQSNLRKYFIYKSNQGFCNNIFHNNQYDILHSTFYDTNAIICNKKPHIITIHDMTPELYPQYFSGTIYSNLITKKWIRGKKQLIDKADKIISISEKTKEDLIKLYNVPENKIKVIYHGYNVLPSPAVKLIEDPYILYVGLRDKYKNFKVFVGEIKTVILKEKIKVLCIGGGKFKENEVRLLKEFNINDYFVQMSVDDAGLASAYNNALCFIYPSEYEGFGMPILEAFSLECPVILSKSSCFPEIARESALYFSMNNSMELSSLLKEVLNNSVLRNTMIQNGKKRILDFSWEKCARKHFNLYKDILN
jgi:glycosyltransferase involved in cell wall biosynthesis